jgi:hypothetical protein
LLHPALYVRARAVAPMDGKSFEYRKGAWRRLTLKWQDATGTRTIAAQNGPLMRWPANQRIDVRAAGATSVRSVTLVRGAATVKL